MPETRFRYPVWVRGDLDGFFGLMVDNLVQVLLIIALCTYVAGLPASLIYTRILPGVAISLLIGNLFYGLQAHYVARRDRRPDTTALPYGINTPSVVAYAYFIMGPVYKMTGDGGLAWKAGLLACLVSGVIEFGGAFFAEKLRRVTPRAALLGVLAAVGITFIAADFAFRIYTSPLVGILPLAFLLLAYFARYRFPLRLPGGFLAVLFGTLIAWGMSAFGWEHFGGVAMSGDAVRASLDQVRWIAPAFVGGELWALVVARPDLLVMFLTVSVPMGLINVLGSLQNIESAEAGGDRFATAPSLAVNGLGTIAAGLFGSCFPTTIYIGHPGWKALGAKAGYSILNGLFFTGFFLFGLGPFLSALIPIEAGAAIVMYIGIMITAQAFQVTPKDHAPAVAVALFPAMAAIVVVTMGLYFDYPGVGVSLVDVIRAPTPQTAYLPGLLALTGANSGWIVVTLILTAIGAALIDHKYKAATVWAAAATVLTLIGAMHAYRLEYQDNRNIIREYFIWQTVESAETEPGGGAAVAASSSAAQPAQVQGAAVYAYRAFPIAVGYGLATIVFALAAYGAQRRGTAARGPAAEQQLAPVVDMPSPVRADLPSIPLVGEEAAEPPDRDRDQRPGQSSPP